MKKRSMSDISHKGGFPRAIDDVVRTNTPLVVTIRGESAVMISPCPPTMEQTVANSIGFGKIIATLAFSGMDEHTRNYAVSQYMNGLYAQSMLLEILSDEEAERLFESGKELVKSIHKSSLDVGRRMINDFENFQKNSLEDKALSRHDNLSASVSEVKDEELLSKLRSKTRSASGSSLSDEEEELLFKLQDKMRSNAGFSLSGEEGEELVRLGRKKSEGTSAQKTGFTSVKAKIGTKRETSA